MIAVGIIGLFVVMALSDPLKARLWAAALGAGFFLLGVAALLAVTGGGEEWL
jgi:hypothetical protein